MIIGVTGHRKLSNKSRLSEQVFRLLHKIQKQLALAADQSPSFTVLSPLAEGADRLIARETLRFPNSRLHVVLPLEQKDYEKDFGSHQSRVEFRKFVSQASCLCRLPRTDSRARAYAQAGEYVVDHCDILIALWDGQPAAGEGGTGAIIEYARKLHKPIYWIHTEEPDKITEEYTSHFD